MRKRSVGINIRVTVTEKKKVTMLARKCGLSLSEYLRQRALGYEPGGHPPKEVFDVLDKLDEIAENCSAREGAAINAQTDRMRDLFIGSH
ncbi:plasmid mobilization protein [Gemmiger formicilis]|uniref:plasmid mobilization protein n=1 Tax=Gemmiger formicilis TaxID=745368 RepID=UPI003AB21357